MNSASFSQIARTQRSSTEQNLRDEIAELHMANCMLADFAALLSHDMRVPFAASEALPNSSQCTRL